MDETSVRKHMQQVVELISTDLSSIRTGKATPSLVSDIEVSAYGGQQTLKVNELATVTAPDAESIIIDPWDKSIIGDIKKGIEAANVGLTPNIDGEIIRINIPPMTKEDREKLVKLLRTKVENGKIMVRQIRGDQMKDIRKQFEDKQLSEDERFNTEKKLQDITDSFNQKLDELEGKKEKELMTI
ncbi:ribosome recycling factor [Candidatus Woesebacteria bacterium]|nr:ribosome recycling factor [Candidatus Woesebacteria bacterium]